MSDPANDAVMQQVLERTTDHRLSGPLAAAAAAAVWAALKQDLAAGGWSQLHRQASVVQPASRPAPSPGEVTVTVMWSGTRPITGPIDRRLSRARGVPSGPAGAWQIELLP